MNREEAVAAARQQAAAMLMAYHEALQALLNDLVALVPERQRESYRLAVQRFIVTVLALAAGWSKP